jgi:hypothetical protein
MRTLTKFERRQAFYGWLRWTPLLVVVFAVLFFDAWINIQTLRSDYILGEIVQEMRTLEEQLHGLRVKAAANQTLDLLGEAAPALGLKEPSPEQVETIVYNPVRDGAAPLNKPFVMAQLEGKRAVQHMASPILFSPIGGILPALIAEATQPAKPAAPPATPLVLLDALTPPMDLPELAPQPSGPVELAPATPDLFDASPVTPAQLARF